MRWWTRPCGHCINCKQALGQNEVLDSSQCLVLPKVRLPVCSLPMCCVGPCAVAICLELLHHMCLLAWFAYACRTADRQSSSHTSVDETKSWFLLVGCMLFNSTKLFKRHQAKDIRRPLCCSSLTINAVAITAVCYLFKSLCVPDMCRCKQQGKNS